MPSGMLRKFFFDNSFLKGYQWQFGNKLYQSTSSRNVSTVTLSYNEFGDDTASAPVVIMHGLFGSKQNWRSISKALAAKSNPPRKVITLDARNHGESPHTSEHTYEHLATDVAEFLTELNIGKAIVVGHSMGGRAMMYLALKYPQMIDRAVIVDISPVNTSSNLKQMGNVFGAMQSSQIDASLSMSEGRQQVKEHLSKSVPDPATVDFLLLNLRKSDDRGFYWAANVDALKNNFSDISSFPHHNLGSLVYNGPVLFIAGRRSDFVRNADLPEIKKIFPNAELQWLDTGHLVQLEKPAEFISHVLNFINN